MSDETSKALKRRLRDPNFATHYFVGRALDIGAGNDSLGKLDRENPRAEITITELQTLDAGVSQ